MSLYARWFVICVAVVAAMGCHQAGLSPREGATSYAHYLMALYDEPGTMAAQPPAVTGQMRLAVSQVGEVGPSQEMVEYLRQQPQFFTRVEGIPGVFDECGPQNESLTSQHQRARAQVERVMRFARDVGMTQLFLYGGTVDYGTESNPLAVLDWTIVGAYFVPGKNVKALAKGSGALIDLASGRVSFIINAEEHKDALTTMASSEGTEQKVLMALRAQVINKLADNLVAETSRRTGAPVVRSASAR